MDHETLLKYLKHLDALIAQIETRDHVFYQDVVPLRSELRDFRARVIRADGVSPRLKELLTTLELKIDDSHLEGSPKTKLLSMYSVIAGNSVFLRAWRARKKEKIQPELSRVRSEIRDLYRAIAT